MLLNFRKIIVGGRRVTINEVINVAYDNFRVQLDSSIIDASFKLENQDLFTDLSPCISDSESPFDVIHCRAGLFCLVISLSQGRSAIRWLVIEHLILLLNSSVIPCFSTLEGAGLELTKMLTGSGGKCFFDGAVTSSKDAFNRAGLNFADLFQSEALTLSHSKFMETGISCLLLGAYMNTFHVADVVGALSCDAIGSPLEPFEATRFEVYRQHRGQMTSASNIRLMLEGSKSTIGIHSPIDESFTSIPQIHGPIAEFLSSASKYVCFSCKIINIEKEKRMLL